MYEYVRNDPQNKRDATGLSYYDVNVSAGFGIGVTFGVFYDPDTGDFHPYAGGGAMTPGVSVCFAISQESVSPGQWGWQAQGELGPAFGAYGQGGGTGFGEVGIGWGYPSPFGASATGYYTW